MGAIIKDDFNE
jgi:hypothetical protein